MSHVRYLLMGLLAAAGLAAIFHPPGTKPAVSMQTPLPKAQRPVSKVPRAKALVVYVAGAVTRPGLYRLPPETRAYDAVARAGGLRPDADATGVNLAEVLFDGEEIAAPVLGSKRPSRRTGIRKPARAKKSKSTKNAAAQDLLLDLNSADAQALAQLPGIGDEMARRLVAYRGVNGPFASLDELADVAGMTAHRIELVTPLLYLNRR